MAKNTKVDTVTLAGRLGQPPEGKSKKKKRARRANPVGFSKPGTGFKPLPEYDPDFRRTQNCLAHLRDMIEAVICKPFELIPCREQPTASTDAVSKVYFNPYPFELGLDDVGYGIGIHEAGHIVNSPYAVPLLEQAGKAGGEALANILNILLDRKDDDLTARQNPGYAHYIWGRLDYLLPKKPKQIKDAGEDFIYACKKRVRAKTAAVAKCMTMVRRAKLGSKSQPDTILRLAKKIMKELFAEPSGKELRQFARKMEKEKPDLLSFLLKQAKKLQPEGKRRDHMVLVYVHQSMCSFVANVKKMRKLENGPELSNREQFAIIAMIDHMELTTQPDPIENGLRSRPRSRHEANLDIINVGPASVIFDRYETSILGHIQDLQDTLQRLTEDRLTVIRGQDEGDVDMDDTVGIATEADDIHCQTYLDQIPTAAISLVLDVSGSTKGNALMQIKRLGVLFCSALDDQDKFEGEVWAFHSSFYFCGKAQRGNGLVTLEADHQTHQGEAMELAVSHLKDMDYERKLMIVICDGGPNSDELVKRANEKALQHGIEPILILVIDDEEAEDAEYIQELLDAECNRDFRWRILYNDYATVITEFGTILEKILRGEEPDITVAQELPGAEDLI
jgi:hypothetical protein